MNFQPVNLVELVGTFFGMMVVLIPVMGVTVRYAAKPLIDALLHSGLIGPTRVAPPQEHLAELARLSRRVLELEQALGRRKLEPVSSPLDVAEPVVSIERARERT
jgi:hypothetical protein